VRILAHDANLERAACVRQQLAKSKVYRKQNPHQIKAALMISEVYMIEIFFDGLCAPKNPGGIATYGFVVIKDGKLVKEGKGVVGEGKGMTNNVAEYNGLLKAVEFVLEKLPKEDDINIYGDSRLVVSQVPGLWKLNSETAQKYAPMIREKLLGKNVKYNWIPRLENARADSLTEEAYFERAKMKSK
jgi:ribonuclease HI